MLGIVLCKDWHDVKSYYHQISDNDYNVTEQLISPWNIK